MNNNLNKKKMALLDEFNEIEKQSLCKLKDRAIKDCMKQHDGLSYEEYEKIIEDKIKTLPDFKYPS